MKNAFIAISLLLNLHHVGAQESVVFKSGEDGHKTYRIPAIISLQDGTLLAFSEGRVNDGEDFGDIDLVMKKSVDHGKSWSALETVVDQNQLQAGNPAPVLDLLDPYHPSGVVYLFYNTGNNHEGEVRKGNGVREVWYIRSFDGGTTWETPVNITLQIHKPLQPNFNSSYNFKEDWRTYANTPGHAFQFLSGKYKGRIFIPANHSQGSPQSHFHEYQAHGFYTDNHGESFKLGASISIPGSNEATATELSNSKMIMSIRNQAGDIKRRIIGVSSDGGEHWDTAYYDQQLIDPNCEGSLLTIGFAKGKAIIAHCNAASEERRDNLTVKISYNEGKTWEKSFLISASNNQEQSDWSAYSDLVLINKKTIGILFERNDYTEIVFKTQHIE